MSRQIRAAIAVEHDQPLRVETVTLRAPGPGEVLVQLKASGLCHTDLSVISGAFPSPLPTILGHEGAGVVVETGAGVTAVAAGDPVVVNNFPHCGRCRGCRSGRTNFCEAVRELARTPSPFTWRGEPLNRMSQAASFATHTVVRADQVTPIPASVPFASAALVPCGVLTGLGAVRHRADVEPGSSVVVFGLGSIGLNVVQAARISGAARIVAVDTNPAKLRLGREFGATDVVDASGPASPSDVAASDAMAVTRQVKQLLAGPADFAFECVGDTGLIEQALALVNPYWGVCVAVGIAPHDQRISLPASSFHLGRSLLGTSIGDGNALVDIPLALGWYADGSLKLDELVTHRFGLDEINDGVDALVSGRAVRPVVLYE